MIKLEKTIGLCYTVGAQTDAGRFVFKRQPVITSYPLIWAERPPCADVSRPACSSEQRPAAHWGRFAMNPDARGLLRDLIDARNKARDLIGFDFFTSPRFSEQLVCNLCDIEPSEKRSSRCDGTLNGIFQVEIKHSNATYSEGRDNSHQKYFRWERLQGRSRAGKQADVYILTGYDSETNGTGCLSFFVLPAWVIANKYSIEIGLHNRSFPHKLSEYETDIANLKETVNHYANFNRKLKRSLGD